MPEPDDLKRINLGINDEKTFVRVTFVREDDLAVPVTLSPETLSQLIVKLQTLYDQMKH